MKNNVVSAALAASVLSSSVVADGCANVLTPTYKAPTLADGWSAQLIVQNLKKPRSIQFDTSGNLIVVESGKGISRISFKDNGGTCLEVDRNLLIIENTALNHGLAFSDDGKTLYASTVESVFAWDYQASTGTVGTTVKEVVNKMSNNALVTRTLLMSKKAPGKLVVSRGADENNDVDAMNLNSGLSQIRVFDLNKMPSSGPFNFNQDGTVLGWGLRNAVGMAEDPSTGNVWCAEASIDDITRDGTDIHQNNPAEELNYLGPANATSNSTGANFGYPVCYALWDTIPKQGDLKVGDQFAMESSNDTLCSKDYKSPRLVFQAHSSPLSLLFSADGRELYVAFHGSFDRTNPVGYTLSVADFSASGQPVADGTSKDAAKNIMSNPTQSDCPDGCFRPLGLAWDSQGRLWMTSDSTGEIYVLQKSGSSSSSSTNSSSSSGDSSKNTASRQVGAAVVAGAAALVAALLMA